MKVDNRRCIILCKFSPPLIGVRKMPANKIAWENWDSDVLEQEIIDNILESEDFEEEEA